MAERPDLPSDFVATDVRGVYGSGAIFEGLVATLDRRIEQFARQDGAEPLHLPPVMSRAVLERSGYLHHFPHFAGTVHAFSGNDDGHRDLMNAIELGHDWTGSMAATDLVLKPAACYPIYPILAARGPLDPAGATITTSSYCFRREPSDDPARMQAFRMRECIHAGSPDQVGAFRKRWMSRALEFAHALGLTARLEAADDPFFGRLAVIKHKGQRARELKYELMIAIAADGTERACASFNLHETSFSKAFGLTRADGVVHTACVGFGLERMALAVLARHGGDPAAWPGALAG